MRLKNFKESFTIATENSTPTAPCARRAAACWRRFKTVSSLKSTPIPIIRTVASASKAPPRRKSSTLPIVCNIRWCARGPKAIPIPGWVRITWDQALNLAALRLNDIKDNYGAEAVVFSRATTAGSAAIDFDGWLQRLANAFGSPNLLTSNHICTWNRRVGSKYTYGTGMPLPDFDNTQCMLLWGINPTATSPAQAVRINRARNRGAKLIVIDPRKTTLASKGRLLAARETRHRRRAGDGDDPRADRRKSFRCRIRAPLDQRTVSGSLRQQSIADRRRFSGARKFRTRTSFGTNEATRPQFQPINQKLAGTLRNVYVTLSDGTTVKCQPALQMLKDTAAAFAPELSESITTVPAEEVRKAVRLFANEKPSSYCTWVGLEQDNDAMQTNRAVCCFYALTGQFDQRGSNVIFATTPTNPNHRPRAAAESKKPTFASARKNIRSVRTPTPVSCKPPKSTMRSSPASPIRSKRWYCSAAIHCSATAIRCAAKPPSKRSISTCTSTRPSTRARCSPTYCCLHRTCWEREALMPSFEIAEDTMNWAQLRPAVVKPAGRIAVRYRNYFRSSETVGSLTEQFFDGDIDAALNYQLAPSGIYRAATTAIPGRIALRNVTTRHRKYAEIDAIADDQRGFDTPTRKIEIYSTTFANAGYAPLPEFDTTTDINERSISAHTDLFPRYPILRRTAPQHPAPAARGSGAISRNPSGAQPVLKSIKRRRMDLSRNHNRQSKTQSEVQRLTASRTLWQPSTAGGKPARN